MKKQLKGKLLTSCSLRGFSFVEGEEMKECVFFIQLIIFLNELSYY